MNPWTFIGWVAATGVALVLGVIALAILGAIVRSIRHYVWHLRDRNIPPAEGQRWAMAGVGTREITRIVDNGRIVWESSTGFGSVSASWSPDEFRNFVRLHHAWLERD